MDCCCKMKSYSYAGMCLTIVLIACSSNQVDTGRAGGGGGSGGGGGGGGGSRSRGGGAGSSYGSSSSSGFDTGRVQAAGIRGQPQYNNPGAGSSSQWGSSMPSGVNRAAGSNNARPNYAAAGVSAQRSSNNRPIPNTPVASGSVPIQTSYNTHYTTINSNGRGAGGFGTGSLLLAGAGGAIGGYMLGSMLTSSLYHDRSGCCYGCGCTYYGATPPYYYNDYVPYRYRYYQDQPTIVTNVPPSSTPLKSMDLCTLARWNMELPFTELPNMLLTFLSNDNISGSSMNDKSRFLFEFFNTTAAPYGSLNATSNVFTIPPSYDLSICNFNIPKQTTAITSTSTTTPASNVSSTTMLAVTTDSTVMPWYGGNVLAQWRQMVRGGDRNICIVASFAKIPECNELPSKSKSEEPFFTGVKQITRLYSNMSSDQQMLTELVASVKRCYPTDQVPPKSIQACLDFSLSSDQAVGLQNQTSLFDNEEICRKYLNPDINKCIPSEATFTFPCTLNDLVNLNVFVRNYYLCNDPVDASLVLALQSRQSGKMNVSLPIISLDGTINSPKMLSPTGQLVQNGAERSTSKLIIITLAFACLALISLT